MQLHHLSRIEKSFWMNEQVADHHNYVIISCLLGKHVSIEHLQKSLELIIDETPQFHSTIVLQDGMPFWKTAETYQYPITVATADDATFDAEIAAFPTIPFQLNTEFACRFKILRGHKHTLFLSLIHHVVFDQVSLEQLAARISELYTCLHRQQSPQERKQHAFEYAQVEDKLYSQTLHSDAVTYWNEYLAHHQGEPIRCPFPESVQAGKVVGHRFELGLLQQGVSEACPRLHTSAFRILMAAWAVTVLKISGNHGIYVNYAVNLRPDELAGTIGAIVSNQLLHVGIDESSHVKELIEKIAQDRRDARPFQYVSFLDTDMHHVVRNSSSSIGFSFPTSEVCLHLDGETYPYCQWPVIYLPTDFQLNIQGDLAAGVVFANTQFPHFYAEMLANAFLTVLSQIVSNADIRVSDIVLTPQHDSWNQEVQPLANATKSLIELFHNIVRQYGDRTAIVNGNEQLTFAQLEQWSDEVAVLIKEHVGSVETSGFIGVYANRSLYLPALFLGVWKAGYAYIPIDPLNSAERLHQIIDDCKPVLVLTDLTELPVATETLYIDRHQLERSTRKPVPCPPSHLAYMIYTSGTTGKPKGTPITQRSLVNLIEARQTFIPATENLLELCFASISFDASVWEMFPALFTGTALYIASEEERHDPQLLSRLLCDQPITCACIPPVVLTYLPLQKPKALKYLVVAGESCPIETIRKWQPFCKVINAYGPTENTVCATAHCYAPNDVATNIGRPLLNVTCYVVDEQRHLLPIGVVGELCIGGEQLTDGYYNRQAQNQERFMVNPFSFPSEQAQVLNSRIYATGDMVCRLADGSLLFCGRRDLQTKIRGHRIELGEIVSCMERHPDIRIAAATVIENHQHKQLFAFAESRSGNLTTSALRRYMDQQLPSYLQPHHYILVSEMPMTINGKIDMKALTVMALHHEEETVEGITTPDSEQTDAQLSPHALSVARHISDIWQELLGHRQPIGLDDSFLQLGGDSIMAVQIAQAIELQLGISISVSQVYKAQTIRQMALLIEPLAPTKSKDASNTPATLATSVVTNMPLHLKSLLTECMISEQLSQTYHLVQLIPLACPFDKEATLSAWNELVRGQEVLRMTFGVDSLGAYMMTAHPYRPVTSLQEETYDNKEQLDKLVRARLTQPFELLSAPLCRPVLYRDSASEGAVMAIFIHHLVTDGWSMRLLKEQFLSLYESLRKDAKAVLSLPPHTYTEYARQLALSQDDEQAQYYWQNYLHDFEDIHLPYVKDHDSIALLQSQILSSQLPMSLTDAITGYCEQHRLTLFSFFASAFMLMLARACRQTGFVIGYPSAGRSDVRFSQVVGYFVHPLPLRFDDSLWPLSFVELCEHTHADTLAAEQHLLAFSQLAAIASSQGATDVQFPLVQAMFSFANFTPEQTFVNDATAQFPLCLTIYRDAPEGWTCHWQYAVSRLGEQTVQRFSHWFVTLLQNILDSPDKQSVSSLCMLSEDERLQVIRCNTLFPLTTPTMNVVDLFKEQVALTPQACMVKDCHSSLSFSEADAASDHLAAILLSYCPKTVTTGMFMNRTLQSVVAMLAILKAGHTYVPLDGTYPVERLRMMVQDCSMRCLVYSQDRGSQVDALVLSDGVKTFCYEEVEAQPSALPYSQPDISSTTRAYIIYTSGTTGMPKGVVITHGNLAALSTVGGAGRTNPKPGEVVLLYSSYLFDASINDVFPSLLNGACLVCINDEERRDPERLFQIMEREHVSHVLLPPAFVLASAKMLPPSLTTLIVGGEAPTQAIVDRYHQRLTLINAYGPTENTVITTANNYRHSGVLAPNCIGKPLPGVSCYVLDEHLNLLPPSCPGQLFVGGLQLSPGYLNRTQLTDELFIANPYVSEPDAACGQNLRIYATGDIVAQDEKGNIYFFGRKDMQVKIRGFRIELHEIENVLQQHPEVGQCVVVVKQVGTATQLAAYVMSSHRDLKPQLLRDYLSSRLPAYMVPAYWYIAQSLPVNSSGKIDRHHLPEPHLFAASQQENYQLLTARERDFAKVIAEVLNIEPIVIGPDTDLFSDLGITSLQVIEASAILGDKGMVVSPSDIFRQRTIRKLAQIGQSQPVFWHEGYDAEKPVVVLVCGYTAAHPFYSDYLRSLRRHFSVLVFDTFSFWNAKQTSAPDYVDYLVEETRKEMSRVGASVFAVTGHSIGSELGMLLAERLRQHDNPDIRVVSIGTSLHNDERQLRYMDDKDALLKQMLLSMPPLQFGGHLSVVLEEHPSASPVLNGQDIPGFREESARFLCQNHEAWTHEYPHARIVDLNATHFTMLKSQYLSTIIQLFFEDN